MVYGKLCVSTVRLMTVSAALFSQVLFAAPPGGRMGPEKATEFRIRAAELREAGKVRPELREKVIKDNPALKSYMEGNTKLADLKPSELESLSRFHSAESGSGLQAMKSLTSSLSPESSKAVMAEVAKSVEGQVKGSSANFVAGIMANRTKIANELSEPAKYGVSPERVADLYKTGGSIDRLLTSSFPDAQNAAAIRGNNFKALMEVERAASEIADKKGEDNVRLADSLREAARLGARDKDMLGEMGKVVEEARANTKGESALALEGLGLVGKGVEYAKTNSPEAADIFAKSVAGKDGKVDGIKAEVSANEAKLFDAAKSEISAKAKGLDLSEAKTMGDLVAKLEEAIAKETNADKKAALEELRDEVMSKRLFAAMEASPRYKEMTLAEKVRLGQCMLRAAGLRSAGAKLGAVLAITALSGATYAGINDVLDGKEVEGNGSGKACEGKQCVALATKMKVPEKLFSGDEAGKASAGRDALSKAGAPAKSPEAHKQ